MKEEVLRQIIERLKDTKQEIIDRIHSYEEEIKRYKESNKELKDSLSVEVYNEKTEKWTRSLNACKTVKEHIIHYEDIIKKQKDIVTQVLNYNINFGDLDHFFDKVLDIDGFVVETWYGDCTDISKATMIKFPYKASDLTNFNNIRGIILMKADYIVQQNIFFGKNNPNKIGVAKEIIQMLKVSPIMSTFDGLLKYFSDNLKRVDEIAKENGEKIQEIREQEIAKRKDEIRKNIDEINRKIDECKKSLVSIGEVYKLYEQYNLSKDQDTLIKLTEELANLVVISQRESKILKHEDKEKSEEKEETPVEEIKKEEVTTEVKSLDSDYFRSKNTLRIICFLGTEGDSIVDDIDSFDKSMKVNAYRRLNHVFDRLVFDENHIARAGGDPDGSTSKFTLALLDTPYNFTYRRYGEKEDRFRFHAIRRHSDLLEKLGYGKGDLVFFGAAGTFVDNDKARVYNEVGSRAVKKLVGNSRPAELQESFRSIEHITRGYIPVELLADSDKARDFSGKAKGGIDKSIEDGKYILYSELSDASQKNVKKWLDDYFIDQTNTLFKIKDTYKQLKGTSLD